jgi:hypothetical protein
MNEIKNLLIAILFSICSLSYSQNLGLGIHSGIGFYNMNDLKNLNSAVFKSLPFQAKVISDFPPFFYYKPALFMSFNKFSFGFQATFYSTGSRISSKDYSGDYLFDTKITSIAPSAYIDFLQFTFLKNYKLALFSEGGFLFSSLDLKEHLTISDQNITNSSYSLKSKNYYIEPGIKFRYDLYKSISLDLNASYFFQFGKEVFESDKGALVNDENKAIGPDWSGLRFGIAILLKRPLKQ